MSQRRASVVLFALFVLAAGVSVGCGGSNNETVGRQATFTPVTANPGPSTMVMLAGARSNETFTVRIVATGIDDFFGTTFRVAYDSTFLGFVQMDTASSLLLGGVTTSDVLFIEDHGTSGRIDVTATRKQNSSGTLTGVNVGASADVVTLTFKTLGVVTAADLDGDDFPDGALVFESPYEVHATGDVNIPGLSWSGGYVLAE